MSKEARYTAIILKKQAFNEADEIITFFTKEAGKVRGLAKSVKSPKSKLQQMLQALFVVNISLAGNKLPQIIVAEAVKVFSGLRENLEALKRAFYAAELILKFTPDEQINQKLFEDLENFLEILNTEVSEEFMDLALVKFKLEALGALGLNFAHSAEAIGLSKQEKDTLQFVEKNNFPSLRLLKDSGSVKQLNNLLSAFIEYQLERRIKSEQYLKNGNMV